MSDEPDRDPRWLEYQPLDELRPHPRNAKSHDIELLRRGLDRFGYTQPVSVDERTGYLSAGHGRRELLLDDRAQGRPAPDGIVVRDDGAWLVPVTRGWSSADDVEALAQLVEDNQTTIAGGWDPLGLASVLTDISASPLGYDGVGFDADDLKNLLDSLGPPPGPDPSPHSSLASRFLIPPFSLLDARQGYWQDRKRAWLALGIQSELGRGEAMTWQAGMHDYDEYGQRIRDGELPPPTLPDGTPRVKRPALHIDHGGGNDVSDRMRAVSLGVRRLSPGGTPRPATRLGADGRTQRGDGAGKPIDG